ncbi:MAG TPA: thiamine pyrophosphate-dependent enzyme, partial [Solirubrobacteraceae bacterium]|nr:thiamine pyrophosphate-dependent enzyme [Solirubrobacteraceae bacterium]
HEAPGMPAPPAPGRPLLAVHALAGLAARLPDDAVVVEESPSSRHQLNHWLPARTPLGYVSAAMGGLGFAVPGAAGLRRALPDRPVVAIVGDGAAMFGVHGYWAAAKYGAGALIVVLVNDGYKVMDKLAERFGGSGPWPSFGGIDHAALARAQGCDAIDVADFETLERTLDEVVPTLASRTSPLVLAVQIGLDDDFNP